VQYDIRQSWKKILCNIVNAEVTIPSADRRSIFVRIRINSTGSVLVVTVLSFQVMRPLIVKVTHKAGLFVHGSVRFAKTTKELTRECGTHKRARNYTLKSFYMNITHDLYPRPQPNFMFLCV
jgi:hypothetical protein